MPKKSAISQYFSLIGRKGGKAKVPKGLASLTPEERKRIALKGVAARKKAARKKEKQRVAQKPR